MNYRHIYHAGNFCDVFKHCILICLLESFAAKDKPFCFIDSHAGIGLYDLQSEESMKSQEWQQGIGRIFAASPPFPKWVADYSNCISQCKHTAREDLRYYPGSPYLAKLLMREQDKIILNELHPEDAKLLKATFANDPRVSVHQQDAYQALKALLPPAIKRALILIDPPFEQPNEFDKIAESLNLALKKFATGCYAIWYPIKNRDAVRQFHHKIKALNMANILVGELNVLPEDSRFQLNGTGMMIINPPYQLKEKLEELLPWLWKVLSIDNQGSYRIFTL
ncbi:MAG: lactate dehydrogenase [Gammaproteobacteria bacterium]|jgi:23S rRNA (adenine2030-N6)-methyltransferase|nr:lactate dehydrogenase [Gammaproteobacteria bacterium]